MNLNLDIYDIITLITGVIFLSLFTITSIVSYLENEKHAVKKTILLAVVFLPIYILPFISFEYQNLIEIVILILFSLFGVALILPINNFKKYTDYKITSRIDERDVMFSRAELKSNTNNYNEYYKNNPDKQQSDDKTKLNAGLLKKGSTYYNDILFASAKSSFITVDSFTPFLHTKPNKQKTNLDAKKITTYIKEWTKALGADNCGITILKDYHKYSNTGRKNNYAEKVELNHKYAIAFTVEMDKKMMAAAPAGSTVMESAYQYLNVGAIAMQLSTFIKELGYEAIAHIDGNYQVVCPLVAKDAGLGELGRMGLLITPKLGPRVRLAVVTTELPLVIDTPTYEPSITDFCNICKKCADNCPGNAISKESQIKIGNNLRWQINQEACYNYWTICGTDCGKCVNVCPYSHPNNLLHNIIRFGLKQSYLFRRVALIMDNYLYGKKPKPKKALSWIRGVE